MTSPRVEQSDEVAFEDFARLEGLRLRRALVGRYGLQLGTDLHADVMARAWEDWSRIGAMENPVGYLWRVAESDSRRYQRWALRSRFPDWIPEVPTIADHDLLLSLGSLTPDQRVAVVMVHAHKASYKEVAELLDVPVTTVTNLVHRGLARLRKDLEEER